MDVTILDHYWRGTGLNVYGGVCVCVCVCVWMPFYTWFSACVRMWQVRSRRLDCFVFFNSVTHRVESYFCERQKFIRAFWSLQVCEFMCICGCAQLQPSAESLSVICSDLPLQRWYRKKTREKIKISRIRCTQSWFPPPLQVVVYSSNRNQLTICCPFQA